MNQLNHQIRLAARPSGLPKASDWELTMEPVWVPGPGEFVVAVEYLSIDPATRSSIAPAALLAQVAIGAVIEADAIERVTTSEHPGFAVGKHVSGCTRGGADLARADHRGRRSRVPRLCWSCSPARTWAS